MEQTLRVSKSAVMEDVARLTAYAGAKSDTDDEGRRKALERIGTIDDDRQQLERYWEESRSDLCQGMIGLIAREGMQGGGDEYAMTLELSESFDTELRQSMEASMRSFYVSAVTARWYASANKPDAADMASKAAALLQDMRRKALYKKKPTRPVYAS